MHATSKALTVITYTAVSLLAACAGSDHGFPGAPRETSERASLQTPVPTVYVLNSVTSNSYELLGYPSQNANNSGPLCARTFSSTGTPYALGSDSAGNVYVPALGRPSTIYVHRAACGSQTVAITDALNEPVSIAVNGSTIYAAGLKPRKYNGQAVAVCTLQGCTRVLTGPITVFGLLYIAVDSQGNVWGTDYSASNGIALYLWPHGNMAVKVVGGNIGSGSPGPIMFDQHDTLVMIESQRAAAHTFSCNATTAQCNQTRSVALQSTSPVAGALNASNTDIEIVNSDTHAIDVYSYPAFAYVYSYNRGIVNPGAITQVP